jgi:hypothetical protein
MVRCRAADYRAADCRAADRCRAADYRAADYRAADCRAADYRLPTTALPRCRAAALPPADCRAADCRAADRCVADCRASDCRASGFHRTSAWRVGSAASSLAPTRWALHELVCQRPIARRSGGIPLVHVSLAQAPHGGVSAAPRRVPLPWRAARHSRGAVARASGSVAVARPPSTARGTASRAWRDCDRTRVARAWAPTPSRNARRSLHPRA